MENQGGPIAPEELLAELVIRVSKTDQVTVTGPLGNELLCFKMLAMGLNRLTDHFVAVRNAATQGAKVQQAVRKLENGRPTGQIPQRGRWGFKA